jgi:hypothetical protein
VGILETPEPGNIRVINVSVEGPEDVWVAVSSTRKSAFPENFPVNMRQSLFRVDRIRDTILNVISGVVGEGDSVER